MSARSSSPVPCASGALDSCALRSSACSCLPSPRRRAHLCSRPPSRAPRSGLRYDADALATAAAGSAPASAARAARRDGDLTLPPSTIDAQSGHLGSVEAFAADLSHELKNPLAAVRGAAELLAEVETPEERARFAGVVQREVARMERLLSGVREIGWIDARLDSEPAGAVPLHELLPGLVESWRERAPRGVAIELALPRARSPCAARRSA